MRAFLICHEDADLDRQVLPRWLSSFSTLSGMVVLSKESRRQTLRRIRREIRRVGLFRFLDVLAYRAYYSIFLGRKDMVLMKSKRMALCRQYPDVDKDVPILFARDPNHEDVLSFISSCGPDLVIARCKFMLRESIFSIPPKGTFVMHPGICPEYRNAHGCFWALVNDDPLKVGMTLLKVDKGIDTGPVYGYYTYDYDPTRETHVVIQLRAAYDNLENIKSRLMEIMEGTAIPFKTSDRMSATWGQPWLTRYLKWKTKVSGNQPA